jgi:hypothetical protein
MSATAAIYSRLPSQLKTEAAMVECYLRWGAIAFAGATAIYGAWGVFARLRAKDQGFGPNSLQALAIVFFLPTLVVVAAVSEIDKQAIAALLGTVAGYILSSPKRKDKETKQRKGKTDSAEIP